MTKEFDTFELTCLKCGSNDVEVYNDFDGECYLYCRGCENMEESTLPY